MSGYLFDNIPEDRYSGLFADILYDRNNLMTQFSIQLPDESVPYILYQRTQYLKIPHMSIISRLPYKLIVWIESKCRKKKIKRRFIEDMRKEFESISPYIPHRCGNILDIGCGLAGVDYFIYRNKEPEHMYLLDKDKVDTSIWYGYKQKGSAYNSMHILQLIMRQNNIPDTSYTLIDIDRVPFPEVSFDVIISLISWGFHYPIVTYIKEVKNTLSPQGVLIVDIRKDTDCEELLRSVFSNIEIIEERAKSKRLVCKY